MLQKRKSEGPTSWLIGIRHAHLASGRRSHLPEGITTLTRSRGDNKNKKNSEIRSIVVHLVVIVIVNVNERGEVVPFAVSKFRNSIQAVSYKVVIRRSTARIVSVILCSLYVGTLVAKRTTAHHPCHVAFRCSTALVVVSLVFVVVAFTIASRCYAYNVVKLQHKQNFYYNHRHYRYDNSESVSSHSSSAFVSSFLAAAASTTTTSAKITNSNSSKLVLGRSLRTLLSGIKRDTSLTLKHQRNSKQLLLSNRNFTILHRHYHNRHHRRIHRKTEHFRNYRTKREYLTAFDNILGLYREETPAHKRNSNRYSGAKNFDSGLSSHNNCSGNTKSIINSEVNDLKSDLSESAARDRNTSGGLHPYRSQSATDEFERARNGLPFVNGQRDDSDDLPPPVKNNFQFESSTKRSMPPAHVSENSLNYSSVLVLVVSVVVLTVTLGLVTCVLSHYRGATAANSHDAAQTPTTAPMLSVVSAGAAAGVGGMDRLRGRGTARELAATMDRQVRVHAVHTDIAINLPPSIALPDGEDHPFNSRLQIRDAEQEAEIYQKCIKPPPNRTVLESESPPPYRSSSVGLLGSISGSSSSSTDWSGGSAPLVVRCHSMSSTSKRQENSSGSSCGSATTTSATGVVGVPVVCAASAAAMTAVGQKTDFIQRTVKRFTGNKERKNQPLIAAATASTTNMPVVIVPTKPRRISSDQQQQSHSQQQQHSQPQLQLQQQQNSTTGRPKANV